MEFIAAIVAIVAIVLASEACATAWPRSNSTSRCSTSALRCGAAAAGRRKPRRERRARSAASPLEIARQPAPAPPPKRDGRGRDRADHPGSRPLRRLRRRPRRRRAEPAKSFEERFGASWVVWIGGLALALGGIFLVQYSIEAGLIGPGVRVFLGGLLATALIAAGEWTRRREFASASPTSRPRTSRASSPPPAPPSRSRPIYAAYALYDFLVPGTAFVLLGIVALATLAAALLHGPALAALGQVGAFVAPLLIATAQPNYWALYVYLAVVTAASFALARARLWRWLAITAVAFGVLWAFPGISGHCASADAPVALYLVVGFALVAALLVSGLLYGPDAEHGRDRSGLFRRARRLSLRRRRAGARARP